MMRNYEGKKGMDSGLCPAVMDIIDLSKATCMEARKACDHISLLSLGKYKTVPAVVESVIRINKKDKIILHIQNEKTWRIAFSLCGVTLPKDEEPYSDEAFELLRRTIVHRRVEVLLETIDEDGYFVGSLLESNTHVAIPLLEAGLAKLLKYGTRLPINHLTKLFRVEKSAKTKKLKIWENHV
ncbi:unnamed protein product [Prunus armeniaca]|uniref:TNase-like domain-containing protein n=1 Tax=Prunus armeniaca TaxID=36596 RepID=A0A6J5Y1M6_PRUAR|nr:unnamed protein product [Prunus armeniaca]CAB4318413.1 unnamed protein product [Prunus armeniaca]